MEKFFEVCISREDLNAEITDAICALATGIDTDDYVTQRRIADTLVTLRQLLAVL